MNKEIEVLFGTQASASDIEEIKAEFHPTNTANVNIVPYEIYDEDGAEIVVGEVRKTIDGVKKKKPVYEKQMTLKFPSNITDRTYKYVEYDISELNIERYIYSHGVSSNNVDVPNAWDFGEGMLFTRLYCSTDGTILSLQTNRASLSALDCKVTIRYTKTTDQWTAI